MSSKLNSIVRAYWELQGYTVLTMATDNYVMYHVKQNKIQFKIAEYNGSFNKTTYYSGCLQPYTEEEVLKLPEMIQIAKLKAFM